MLNESVVTKPAISQSHSTICTLWFYEVGGPDYQSLKNHMKISLVQTGFRINNNRLDNCRIITMKVIGNLETVKIIDIYSVCTWQQNAYKREPSGLRLVQVFLVGGLRLIQSRPEHTPGRKADAVQYDHHLLAWLAAGGSVSGWHGA